MATVELSVDANLAGLRGELAKIPGLTAEQARLMTAELNKSIKASERAATKAAEATKAAAKSAKEMAEAASEKSAQMTDQFGALGGAAGKLAGGLDLIAPGLGDVGRNIADLADIGEVASQDFAELSAVVGALGVATIAVTAAVGLFALSMAPIAELIADERREAEATQAALDAYTTATEAAQAANDKFATSLEGVNDYIKLATGLESQAEQTTRKRIDALRGEATAQTEATRALIASAEALKARKEEEQGVLLAKARLGTATEQEIAQLKANRSMLEDLNSGLADNRLRLDEVNQATEASVEFLTLEAGAIKQAADNSERKTKSNKSRAASEKELADAQRRAAEEAAQMAAFVDRLASVEESALTESQRLGLEIRRLNEESVNVTGSIEAAAGAVEVLRGRQQALADANTAKALKEQADAAEALRKHYEDLIPSTPLTQMQELELLARETETRFADGSIKAEEYRSKIVAIGVAYAKLKEAQDALSLEEVVAAIQDGASKLDNLLGSLGTISDYAVSRSEAVYESAIDARKRLSEDATNEEKKAAKQRVDDAREQLRRAFEIDKAVKLAQAVVNTATAATSALTAGPIAGPILAAAAIAAGGVQVAAIQSTQPKFHSGGVVGQPDEMAATVRRGEAVLSPAGRSALGDSAINDLNAGVPMGSNGQAIQVVYGHKAFDYFVRNHLRTRMTLPRALGRGTRTGQRG